MAVVYNPLFRSKLVSYLSLLFVRLLVLTGKSNNSHEVDATDPLVWEARTQFPGGGRHHPIAFANVTHGHVLTGSISGQYYTKDFWVYEAATDSWTDLSGTTSDFPGIARSFGYGVASTMDCDNSKAYLGFGQAAGSQRLKDWWEFDMATHVWRQLADFPGQGRRHPAMNFVEPIGEIHVGLGDGSGGNYKDYWSYNIENDEWQQLDDFPSSKRHHPFYFTINKDSYVGFGHCSSCNPYIARDWYRYDGQNGIWNEEEDFASYSFDSTPESSPVTIEARVAGTEFSVTGSCTSDKTLGFVLSGDGDNHSTMGTGEFHVFDPTNDPTWHSLPPHPGVSRWAPGSFVLQGSSQAFLIGGYDRQEQIFMADLWTIDLKSLFQTNECAVECNTSSEKWQKKCKWSNCKDCAQCTPCSDDTEWRDAKKNKNCANVQKKPNKKNCKLKNTEKEKAKDACPIACSNFETCLKPKCEKGTDWTPNDTNDGEFINCNSLKALEKQEIKKYCGYIGTGNVFAYQACKKCGKCKK